MAGNARDIYKKCVLCPRRCGVDRTKGETGFCKADSEVVVASYMLHCFEEPPISGKNGSGAIFFSFCTGRCCFCQNYTYSRGKYGKTVSILKLADIMLELQQKGAHNINLVSPSHYAPSIIEAIDIAKAKGLKIPIVYNTNGYESKETMNMLKNYIDIYMPDAKYSDDSLAEKQCGFIDYSRHNITALKMMLDQAGSLRLDKDRIAKKGLLIRHLVLPGYIDNTKGVLRAIAKNLSNKVYISFMNQYSPIAQVRDHPNLKRKLKPGEYEDAKAYLEGLGFVNGWVQD